ncbi:MAG: hypothetical protein ACLFPQ_06370 [Candidatus Woesearchaeota archaeon]
MTEYSLDKDFATLDITKITPLSRIMKMVKKPQRPGKTCEMTSGFMHEEEILHAAKELRISEDQLKKNLLEKTYAYNKEVHKPKLVKQRNKEHLPYGKCVFYDNNECALGEKMPLHCRLSTSEKFGYKLHLWYVLNYILDHEDPDAIRQWAIYLKTHPTIPGGELEEMVPDKEKLEKILSYEILKK